MTGFTKLNDHDVELVETALLGLMLIDPDNTIEVASNDIRSAEYQFRELWRKELFDAICVVYRKCDGKVDAVLVRHYLVESGRWDVVVNIEHLACVLEAAPNNVDVEFILDQMGVSASSQISHFIEDAIAGRIDPADQSYVHGVVHALGYAYRQNDREWLFCAMGVAEDWRDKRKCPAAFMDALADEVRDKMRPYAEKLKDPRWQKKRLEVLERGGWKCFECGNKRKTLHVHHREYEKGREPWDYDDDIYVVLCKSCHKAEHSKG